MLDGLDTAVGESRHAGDPARDGRRRLARGLALGRLRRLAQASKRLGSRSTEACSGRVGGMRALRWRRSAGRASPRCRESCAAAANALRRLTAPVGSAPSTASAMAQAMPAEASGTPAQRGALRRPAVGSRDRRLGAGPRLLPPGAGSTTRGRAAGGDRRAAVSVILAVAAPALSLGDRASAVASRARSIALSLVFSGGDAGGVEQPVATRSSSPVDRACSRPPFLQSPRPGARTSRRPGSRRGGATRPRSVSSILGLSPSAAGWP